MNTKHYIGMAGIHGCIPATCDSYESYDSAVESLASLHELGRGRRQALKRDGYLELNMQRDGNEYAEISECECSDPGVHSDSE